MSSLWSLVQNENMKIYRRPRTWVMAGLVFAAVVAFAVLMHSFASDSGIGAFAYMSNAASMTFLVFIFSVVIAADIVAGEFTWGTIKLLLIRPVSRSKVLLSKYIAVLLFLLAMLALLFLSSLAVGFIVFGASGEAPVAGEAAVTLGDLFRDYGYRLVELVMNVTFAFMISTVFRSSALAISLAFVIMFASGTVMAILIGMKYAWAKYILFANTDLAVYANGGVPPLEGMSLGFSIAVLLAYYVVFVALAWFIFRKRDVAG
ncbi:ABC transporter permease [Paenibacillus flagellatus]|uniref:ABC transporter permease n=1 Tax=Paenibacillus flagellatus TaxID=2211139 RepID=A0A2V5KMJ4_9BACL|nr:ABC transporter permease [Paenibacillus flagellatus]PYI56400.1 ABC transporter permease [Paenibacillus flagellatus]